MLRDLLVKNKQEKQLFLLNTLLRVYIIIIDLTEKDNNMIL